MIRFFPQSLFGQTLATLLAGLIVSSLVGLWIYSSDREEAVRSVGGLAVVDRVVNVARLVKDAPNEWQTQILAASSDEFFSVSSSNKPLEPPSPDGNTITAKTLKRLLADRLALPVDQQPVVHITDLRCGGCDEVHIDGHHESTTQSEHGVGTPTEHEAHDRPALFAQLQVSIPIRGDLWLNITSGLPGGSRTFSNRFFISMTAMAVILVGISIWVVRRVTSPLTALAHAALKLGEDLNTPPMSVTGTIETRQAARAFNGMQSRLRAMIDDRTRTLAAISHDFRTPLTLLRLRIENLHDDTERDKMLATIGDLDAMVAATLEFASSEGRPISLRRTNLTALLISVVDDFCDSGMPVAMNSAAEIIFDCDAVTLKRAVTNLVENGVKYGGTVLVSVRRSQREIEITVDDTGPGIPEDKLSHVLEPLYRLDDSRSRETGGMGLGLAIAQSGVRAHAGKLTLSNRPCGGLRAAITLPIG